MPIKEAPKFVRPLALKMLAAIADERELEVGWLNEQIDASKDVMDMLREAKNTEQMRIMEEAERRIADIKAEAQTRVMASDAMLDQVIATEANRVKRYEARIAAITEEKVMTEQEEKSHEKEIKTAQKLKVVTSA
jgi:hypothetical protein